MKHRTALITAGSVAAVVLAAGSAVAANLGILTTSTAPVGDLTVSSPVLGDAPPAQEVAVQQDTVAAPTSDDLAAYAVDDAGLVTVRRDGDRLLVEEVVPNLGWDATVDAQGSAVEVTFTGGGRTLRFRAEPQAGLISTTVEEVSSGGSQGDAGGGYYEDDDRYERDNDRYQRRDDDRRGRKYEGYEDDD